MSTEPFDDVQQPVLFREARSIRVKLGHGSGDPEQGQSDMRLGHLGQPLHETTEEDRLGQRERNGGRGPEDFQERLARWETT